MHVVAIAPSPTSAPVVAALVDGLLARDESTAVDVVVATAEDVTALGLRVSATSDAVLDALAGRPEPIGTTVQDGLRETGSGPGWLELPDTAVATHLARSAWLAQGATPSEVLARLAGAAGLPDRVRLRPVTDVPVETHVVLDVPDGEAPQSAVHVREWREGMAGQPTPTRVVVAGLDRAPAAPGVLDAVRSADAVVVAPGDPVLQVGPVLGVPGMSDALRGTAADVVVLDPRLGPGTAFVGLEVAGLPATGPAAAGIYRDIADAWVTPVPETGYARALRVVPTAAATPFALAAEVLALL